MKKVLNDFWGKNRLFSFQIKVFSFDFSQRTGTKEQI